MTRYHRPRLCAVCERPETMRGGKEHKRDADILNGCGELQREPGLGLVCYECWAASTHAPQETHP